MKKILLFIIFLYGALQTLYSQDKVSSDGVVSFSLPIRNSLKFNRFIINPAFSFVREQGSYASFYNKRQWVQFDNAPQTYVFSYAGRFKENQGIALGVFQQNYGVLTTFGGVANFAQNVELQEDSNLTFGINLGFYKSGLNSGKVITNNLDPSLNTIPSNFLFAANPGINYGTAFLDFGISFNNLFLYNFKTSEILKDDPEKSIQLHAMHTGYLETYGFFDRSKFSALVKTELKKEKSIISGLLMFTIPTGIWAQGGYNTLYGLSGGLGLNVTPKISIEYSFEKATGNLSQFGASHEITLAYKFKSDKYYQDDDDTEGALITPTVTKKTVASKPKTVVPKPDKVAAANEAKLAADAKAAKIKAAADAKAKADADAKAKAADKEKQEADAKAAKIKAAADAKAKADADAKAKAADKEKQEADAKAAKIKAAADAKAVADADAKAKAADKEKQEADAKAAKIKADADAKAAAQQKLNAAAQEQALAEAQAKRDAKEKADAAEQAKAAAEAQAKSDAANKTKADLDAQAKAEAEAARIAQENRDAQANKNAEEEAKQAAAAKLAAEEQARANALAQVKLEVEAKDENARSMKDLKQFIEESKNNQKELLNKLDGTVAERQKDLKDLKEENDLSDKGIFKEPKPFKSIASQNSALIALQTQIADVNKNQENKIAAMENLYKERLKTANKNDATAQYYLQSIQTLKADQLKAIEKNTNLLSSLENIKAGTEIEKNRRIKRASFENDQGRYVNDLATLKRIKETTPLSKEPLQPQDFDFGEEQSNLQIVKTPKNLEAGYYLVVAVHNEVAKRDEFLRKAVAAGEKNIDFFYDVNTSKYFIYYTKFDTIEDAKQEQEQQAKSTKPYNGKMVLVRVEN